MFKASIGRASLRAFSCAGLATMVLASCGGGSSDAVQSADSILAASADAGSNAPATTTPSGTPATTPSSPTGPGTSQPTTPAKPSTPSTPSPSAPSTTAPATSPAGVTRVIEYYGDSIVWGYGTGTGARVAKPAPAAFTEALPASPKYDVRNEGVSGTTACQLLNGTDGKHPAWDSQMASSKAAVVIINHAINDEWKVDLATYKSCLTALAQKAKKSGKKVIFETPNPTRDSGPNSLDIYVKGMRDVALQEQLPVIDQYKYLTDYLHGQSPYTICPDGLHPTDAVYIMKGKYAASIFSKLPL